MKTTFLKQFTTLTVIGVIALQLASIEANASNKNSVNVIRNILTLNKTFTKPLTITGKIIFPDVSLETPKSPTNTFTDDFEDNLNIDNWYTETSNQNSIRTFNNYSQSGNNALRVELNKDDPIEGNSKRAEISIDKENTKAVENPLEEHIYTFYTMLPSGGDDDYKFDPNSSEIIAQWQNQPDANEKWTTPPLSLHTYNGNYIIERCWDDAEITTDSQMTQKGNRASHNLGSYINDKGKWVEWKFHVKWGWSSDQKTILEVYKDGNKVLNCNGLPNATNDKSGVRMKLGLCKDDWVKNDEKNCSILNKRVVYYDNVSIS